MTVFADMLRAQAGLDDDAIDHLSGLVEDWQILADLSFADLLLFVPCTDTGGRPAYLCAGQMRPYTAQTIYIDDLVGQVRPRSERPMVGRAIAEGRVIRDSDPDWSTGVPVREEAIPVRLEDRVIAVVTREANVSHARMPSQLELTYLQAASELAQMLAEGSFPYSGDAFERGLSPRVGDGIIRCDADGMVTYASPNAISAYRRLGSMDAVMGQGIAEFDPFPDELLEGLDDGVAFEGEIEGEGIVVVRRLLPLVIDGETTGALLLVREVTELRRQERALRVKDATIREIHHRVKNNLQTVASLLRLQGRRLQSEEARDALAESVRRITSIALVHETLSQDSSQLVNFEKIAGRIVEMLVSGLVDSEHPVSIQLEGEPGDLPAEVATPLALVFTELVQNCVEHAFVRRDRREDGFVGHVVARFQRGPMTLRVVVADDGVGLPEGATLEELANLGLQIARTLVESEMGGTFEAVDEGSGTAVELVVPLP